MKLSIDMEMRRISTDKSNIFAYEAGSAMDYAIRVVEKLVKVHMKAQRHGSSVTSRTR